MITALKIDASDFYDWAQGYVNRVKSYKPVFDRRIYPLLKDHLAHHFLVGGEEIRWRPLTALTQHKPTGWLKGGWGPPSPRKGVLLVTGRLSGAVASGRALKKTTNPTTLTVTPSETREGKLVRLHNQGGRWIRPGITAKGKALRFYTVSGKMVFRKKAGPAIILLPKREIMGMTAEFVKKVKWEILWWVCGKAGRGQLD